MKKYEYINGEGKKIVVLAQEKSMKCIDQWMKCDCGWEGWKNAELVLKKGGQYCPKCGVIKVIAL